MQLCSQTNLHNIVSPSEIYISTSINKLLYNIKISYPIVKFNIYIHHLAIEYFTYILDISLQIGIAMLTYI